MKKLHLRIFTFFFLSFSFALTAQDVNFSVYTIPQELTENANAVVRNESEIITISSVDKMTVRVSRTVTVLNKLGRSYVNASVSYDNDRRVTKFSAEVYDGTGKRIKKFKKKDVVDVSDVSSSELYTDNRLKYIEYTPIQYPYTMKVEYEYKTSSTGFIPGWFPMPRPNLSVERSNYKLVYPSELILRKKEVNFNDLKIQNLSNGNMVSYELKNQKPFKYESNTVSYLEMYPHLILALDNFTLRGVSGKASNWEEFGLWQNEKLIKGRDVLPEKTVAKVKELISGVEDTIEKAKIVYKFMQNKTRYISVQVGIGGWEPIAANQVDKVGYGDCKGLVNYTKALLEAAGVESYYAIVYAQERRDILKDFTSMQGNHVILNIPNKGKDIWLECTSQIMPFGFLGDFTDDRDVLVVTPKGGVIKRTPAYINETNLQKTKATIQLDATGSVKADVEILSKGIQYDGKFGIESKSKEELKKYYKSSIWSYNNNLEVASVHHKNNQDAIEFQEKLKVNIQDYASLSQGEYLFRVNVFNRNSFVPKRYRNRKLPLKISRGYKDIDEYTIQVPEGYALEVVPNNIALDTKFGTYQVSFEKIDEKTLKYKKELLIKEGLYPKEDYKIYRKFRRSIAKYENLRIALTKL